MQLAHLSLAVADQQRSRRFYEAFFGLDCDGEPGAEGCLHLTDAEEFDLTLVERPAVAPFLSLHFGFKVADAEYVRRLLERLTREKANPGELFESDQRVAFQCVDPDGYQLEVFWQPDELHRG